METKTRPQTRREFCASACRGASAAALAGALGVILEGCGGGNPASPEASANPLPIVTGDATSNAITLGVGSGSPLAAAGGMALVQTSIGDFLVAHAADGTFVALSATCTHQGCTITGFLGQDYVCPCHGSTYSANGQVLGGPAPRALTRYQTQLAGDVLTITG
jgi:cytochrome b6-f complex iron-sulfur subunit